MAQTSSLAGAKLPFQVWLMRRRRNRSELWSRCEQRARIGDGNRVAIEYWLLATCGVQRSWRRGRRCSRPCSSTRWRSASRTASRSRTSSSTWCARCCASATPAPRRSSTRWPTSCLPSPTRFAPLLSSPLFLLSKALCVLLPLAALDAPFTLPLSGLLAFSR